MPTTGEWAADGLVTAPFRPRFWRTLVTAGLVFLPPILAVVTWCPTWLRRRTAAPARARAAAGPRRPPNPSEVRAGETSGPRPSPISEGPPSR